VPQKTGRAYARMELGKLGNSMVGMGGIYHQLKYADLMIIPTPGAQTMYEASRILACDRVKSPMLPREGNRR